MTTTVEAFLLDLDNLKRYIQDDKPAVQGRAWTESWAAQAPVRELIHQKPTVFFPLLLDALTNKDSCWKRLPLFAQEGHTLGWAFENFVRDTHPSDEDIFTFLRHPPLAERVAVDTDFAMPCRLHAFRCNDNPASLLCRTADFVALLQLLPFRQFIDTIAGPSAEQIPQALHRDRKVTNLINLLLHMPHLVNFLSVSQKGKLPGWRELGKLKDYKKGNPIPVKPEVFSSWASWTLYGHKVTEVFEAFFDQDICAASTVVGSGFVWPNGGDADTRVKIRLTRTTLEFTPYCLFLKDSKTPFAWRLHDSTAMLHNSAGLSHEMEATSYLGAQGAIMLPLSSLRRSSNYCTHFDTVIDSTIPEAEHLRRLLLTALVEQELKSFPWRAWSHLYSYLSPQMQQVILPYLYQGALAEGWRFALQQDAVPADTAAACKSFEDWKGILGLLSREEPNFVLPSKITALLT